MDALGEEPRRRSVGVVPERRHRHEARLLVESQRLGLTRAGLEDHHGEPGSGHLGLEVSEHRAGQAATLGLLDHVHALDLGGLTRPEGAVG